MSYIPSIDDPNLVYSPEERELYEGLFSSFEQPPGRVETNKASEILKDVDIGNLAIKDICNVFSKMNPIKDKLLTKPQFFLLLKSFSIVSLLNTNGLINFNFTKPFTPLMFKCDSPTSDKVAGLKRPIFQFAFLAKANPRQEPEISETTSSHSQPTSNKGISGVDSLPSAPSHDQPGAHDFDRLAGLFFESFRTSKTIDHQLLADLLKTCPVDTQGQILGKVMYDKLKSYLGKIFANPGQQFKLIYKTYCEPGEEVLFKPHNCFLLLQKLVDPSQEAKPLDSFIRAPLVARRRISDAPGQMIKPENPKPDAPTINEATQAPATANLPEQRQTAAIDLSPIMKALQAEYQSRAAEREQLKAEHTRMLETSKNRVAKLKTNLSKLVNTLQGLDQQKDNLNGLLSLGKSGAAQEVKDWSTVEESIKAYSKNFEVLHQPLEQSRVHLFEMESGLQRLQSMVEAPPSPIKSEQAVVEPRGDESRLPTAKVSNNKPSVVSKESRKEVLIQPPVMKTHLPNLPRVDIQKEANKQMEEDDEVDPFDDIEKDHAMNRQQPTPESESQNLNASDPFTVNTNENLSDKGKIRSSNSSDRLSYQQDHRDSHHAIDLAESQSAKLGPHKKTHIELSPEKQTTSNFFSEPSTTAKDSQANTHQHFQAQPEAQSPESRKEDRQPSDRSDKAKPFKKKRTIGYKTELPALDDDTDFF